MSSQVVPRAVIPERCSATPPGQNRSGNRTSARSEDSPRQCGVSRLERVPRLSRFGQSQEYWLGSVPAPRQSPQPVPTKVQEKKLYEHELPHAPQLLVVVRSVSHGAAQVPYPGGQAAGPHVPPVHESPVGQSPSLQQAAQPVTHILRPAPHEPPPVVQAPASVQAAACPPVVGQPPPHDCAQPVLGSFGPFAVHVAPQRWKPLAQPVQPGPDIPAGQPASPTLTDTSALASAGGAPASGAAPLSMPVSMKMVGTSTPPSGPGIVLSARPASARVASSATTVASNPGPGSLASAPCAHAPVVASKPSSSNVQPQRIGAHASKSAPLAPNRSVSPRRATSTRCVNDASTAAWYASWSAKGRAR